MVAGRRAALSHQHRIFHSSKAGMKSAPSVAEPVSFSSRLASWPKENPFLFQLGIATAKTSGADLIVQVSGNTADSYCSNVSLKLTLTSSLLSHAFNRLLSRERNGTRLTGSVMEFLWFLVSRI